MTRDEALAILGALTYRPGWGIRASAVPGAQRRVEVSFTIDTVDTSHPTAQGAYEVPLREESWIELDSSLYDSEEALLRRVLTAIGELAEHEDREFLRVRRADGSWQAPLHPHTTTGQEAWKRVNEQEGAS